MYDDWCDVMWWERERERESSMETSMVGWPIGPLNDFGAVPNKGNPWLSPSRWYYIGN